MNAEEWTEPPSAFGPDPVVPMAAAQEAAAPAPLLGVEGEKSERAKTRKQAERRASGAASDALQQPAVKKLRGARTAEQKAKADPLPVKVLQKLSDEKHEHHAHHEHLAVSKDGSQIWCQACGSGFGTRKNVWTKHLESESHRSNVKRRGAARVEDKSEPKQPTMDQALVVAAKAKEKARRLALDVQQHRKRVARALMASGIPITSLAPDLIELLSEPREHRLGLGDMSNLMREFGDDLAAEALREDQEALRGENVAFCFDTTPGRDDVGLVVARTCGMDWIIRHRLVAVKLFKRSLTAENTIRLVDSTREELMIPRNLVRVGLSDGCNVMKNVAENLAMQYEQYQHVFCLPHALAKVLPRFEFPLLPDFMGRYNAVFKNSFAGRAVFQNHVGVSWKRGHKIRWNASHVQHKQVLDAWPKLGAVLSEMANKGLCKESLLNLKGMYDNNHLRSSNLYLQLIACIEGADPFVRATAFLEGDGFLAPFVTTRLAELKEFVDAVLGGQAPPVVQMPRVADALSGLPMGTKAKVWRDMQAALKPGLQYLYQLNRGDQVGDNIAYQRSLALFRFAYLLHPACTKLRHQDFRIAEQFTEPVQHFLGEQLVAEMIADFPDLVAVYRGFEDVRLNPEQLLAWWKEHGGATKSWARAARLFTLLQPTSALAERAGAIMRSRVSDQQSNMLEQTTELYCKHAYRAAEAKALEKNEKVIKR
jgi:hypothetical protein